MLEVSLDTTFIIPVISLKKIFKRKEGNPTPTGHLKSYLPLPLLGVFKLVSISFSSDPTVIIFSKLYILQLGLFITCPSVIILRRKGKFFSPLHFSSCNFVIVPTLFHPLSPVHVSVTHKGIISSEPAKHPHVLWKCTAWTKKYYA